MVALSQMFGGGIKSVQRGEATLGSGSPSVTVTISPVNPQKSYCSVLTAGGAAAARMSLTNGTTLSFSVNGGTTISWEVIEFY